MKKQDVWESPDYINKAHLGSSDMKHPAMQKLIELSRSAKKIIDLGCGEGTRLGIIAKGKEGTGVDISKKSVEVAKEKNKTHKFVLSDLSNLPFEDSSFDLVYSAYVLEHLSEPNRMIKEAVRVLRKDGKILFVAPNYGAPNRASPPYNGSRIQKFLSGFINDVSSIFTIQSGLGWNEVEPISDKKYKMDYDTTVEPYIRTLIIFLKKNGVKIIESSSLWSQELPNSKFHQKLFSYIGKLGVYPFKYWGPHLLVVGSKQ